MSLQDLKKHEPASKAAGPSGKSVSALINSKLILLEGNWKWHLHANAVFCSDVILSFPSGFEGTSGIIHPDDLSLLKENLAAENAKVSHLVFRIITTYGEVKTLEGRNIVITQEQEDRLSMEMGRQEILQLKWQKEHASLQLIREISEKDERYRETGIWYYNLATNSTWYSDEVYRIHGLPPQSLNAHLNTFNSFIHPGDKEAVQEFWTRAFKEKIPLHIEYRIQTPIGEKHVSYLTQWSFSPKGELVLSGTVQDITQQKQLQLQIEEAIKVADFYKQQTAFDEHNALLGHWQVNLLTRKTIFSNNYYRIHGLKPQPPAPGIDAFLNYVHTDDREAVSLAYKEMLRQQTPPGLDYRIVRMDGKLRYISLKAKRILYGNEVIIAGTIQDVTVQRTLEKKAAALIKKDYISGIAQRQTEELSGTATWVKEAGSDAITWSEGFYSFLNYKPHAVELSLKLLISFIHPDDKKNFGGQLEMAMQHKDERTFVFRLVQRGSLRHVKAFFSTRYNDETEYFVAALHDVSPEYLLQKQLQNQAQLTDALSANVPYRIMITDANNNLLLWNRQCEEFYKIKKEEAIGQNFFDIFPQSKTDEEMMFFNRVLNGQKISLKEVKSVMGYGYFDLDMLPVRNEESGEITGIIHIIQDVTKELELRQSMKERLSFISNLLEASVDRIIALDVNMNYLYWNKKAEEYYGLESDEVVGKNILEVFPAFINDPSYAQFRQALRGETIYIPAQENLENRDGYFETYLIPVREDHGTVVSVLWITHDLEKEYLLLQHQRQYLSLIENTPDVITRWNKELKLVFANSAFETKTGLSNENLLGKNISEMGQADEMARPWMESLRKVFDTGEAVEHFNTFPTPGGEAYFYSRIVPERNAAGEVETVLAIARDITERKKAEEELKQSKHLVQTVFDVSLNPIAYHKAVRNASGEIVDFEFELENRIARKYAAEDRRGKKYSEAYPGIKDTVVFKLYCDVVETGKEMSTEVQLPLKGTDRWFHLMGVKLNDGLVATALDITERKKAESEIIRLKDEVAQKATDKYHSLFNSIDEGFCIIELLYDKNGKVVDYRWLEANPNYEKHSGIKNPSGKLGSEIIPSTENYWLENYDNVIKTGKASRFENWHGATGRWYQTYASRIGGNDSRQIAIVFDDITERKQREQQQKYLLQLNDALRPVSDPVEVQQAAMQILGEYLKVDRVVYAEIDAKDFVLNDNYVSEGTQKLIGRFSFAAFGNSVKKLQKGQTVIVDDVNLSDYDDAEKQSFFAVGVHAVVAVPLIKNGQLVVNLSIHHQKPRHWREDEIALIKETAERTWAAVERAKAEEALRKSEEKYRSIFESVDEGFCIMELIFDEQGCIADMIYREANAALESHTGYSVKSGTLLSKFMPHVERYWHDSLMRVHQTGVSERMEGYNADTRRWFSVQYSRVGDAGSNLIAAVFNDIMQRKQREQQQDFLLRFSDQLRKEATADAVANRALEMLIEHLRLDRSYIVSYYLNKDIAILDYQIGNETVPPLPATFDLSHYPEASKAILDHTLVIEDDFERQGLSEEEKQASVKLGMRAMVAATVRKGENNPLWSMVAINSQPRRWTSNEIELIEEVAERTWAALERAKAEETLTADLAGMQRLYQLYTRLSTETDLKKALEKIVAVSADFLNTDRGCIQLVSTDGERLEMYAYKGYTENNLFIQHFMHEGSKPACDAARRNKSRLMIEDVENFEPLLGTKDREVALAEDIRATQSTPIIDSRGGLIGVLSNQFRQPHRPTEEQLKLIDLLAWLAADLIERMQAEEALRRSEDQLKDFNTQLEKRISERTGELQKNLSILQHTEELAHTGSWEYEIATGQFTWSEGMYNLFGLPQGTAVRPETYLDFAVEEDRPIAQRIVDYFKKDHCSFEEVLRIKADDAIRRLKVKGDTINNKKGKPKILEGIDLDITDIEVAIKQMEESRNLLQQTTIATPDALTIYDLDQKQPVYLNNCLGHWVGYTNEELVAMGMPGRLQLIHAGDREK